MKDTQRRRLETFRDILKKYLPGNFLELEDFNLVVALFKNHPHWNIKEGVGIEKIQVIKDKWHKLAYLIYRKDGTTTDISFVIAAKGKSFTSLQRIKGACRVAIVPEILKFKNTIRWGEQRCPITGNLLIEHDTHIDHYNLNFAELFNEWIKKYKIEYLEKCLNDESKDNVIQDEFINKDIEQDFINFHNQNTHLRAVTKDANLSILRQNCS